MVFNDKLCQYAMKGQEACRFGVLTASDRATLGEYVDLSGPAIEDFLRLCLSSPWSVARKLVPDVKENIEEALIELVEVEKCNVIITTGGTGPAIRDVTPEATESVCERILPGFGEQMRQVSLQYVPTAILSRQIAGIRGKCLIINLPGSPRSIREILDVIFASVPYCVDLIGGPYISTNSEIIEAFRPSKK